MRLAAGYPFGEPIFSDAQLSEALRRFRKEFPGMLKHICSKVRALHNGPPLKSVKWGDSYVRDVHKVKR